MKRFIALICGIILSASVYAELTDSQMDEVKGSWTSVTNKITAENALDYFNYSTSITNNSLTLYILTNTGYIDVETAMPKIVNNPNIGFHIRYSNYLTSNDRYYAYKYMLQNSNNQDSTIRYLNRRAGESKVFNIDYESELLPIYKKLASEGKYNMVFCALGQINMTASKNWNISDDYVQFIRSNLENMFNSVDYNDILLNNKNFWNYSYLLINSCRFDYMDGDSSLTKTQSRYRSDIFKKYYSDIPVTYLIIDNRVKEDYLSSGTNEKYLIKAAKNYSNNNKNTRGWELLYNRVDVSIPTRLTAALNMDDVSKVIDILNKVPMNLTADQINKIIEMLNAVDVDYRSSEIASILKNINAKYTTKLYSDQKTWEPIIAKIRAMIDVRK